MPHPRSRALDGLRALAALSVLCFHVWLYRDDRPAGPRSEPLDHVMFELSLGLICFFVLSGYLLYRSFARAAIRSGRLAGLRDYGVRRAARIVPAYYASLAGCLVLYAAVGYDAIAPSAGELPLFAAFAQNYSYATIMEINPVTWTLCVEAAFYVALPLLALAALRLGRQAPLLAGLVAVTIVWNALVQGLGWNDIASKSLLAYIGHFALGMLVAVWVERRQPALGPRATAALALAGAALVVANGWWYETPAFAGEARAVLAKLPAALGFALVIAAVAGGRGRAVGWLGGGALARIGVISYGVYLWHLPLILAFGELGLLPAPLAPRIAAVLVLALGAGWLSWTLVERPAIRWAAAAGARRRAPKLRLREAQAAP